MANIFKPSGRALAYLLQLQMVFMDLALPRCAQLTQTGGHLAGGKIRRISNTRRCSGQNQNRLNDEQLRTCFLANVHLELPRVKSTYRFSNVSNV